MPARRHDPTRPVRLVATPLPVAIHHPTCSASECVEFRWLTHAHTLPARQDEIFKTFGRAGKVKAQWPLVGSKKRTSRWCLLQRVFCNRIDLRFAMHVKQYVHGRTMGFCISRLDDHDAARTRLPPPCRRHLYARCLPRHVLLAASSFSDLVDLVAAARVCKSWSRACEADQLWHSLYLRRLWIFFSSLFKCQKKAGGLPKQHRVPRWPLRDPSRLGVCMCVYVSLCCETRIVSRNGKW